MLKGHEVDFVPRIPIVMQYAAEYIGSNYGAFASDYAVLVEANCRCAQDFGFEQLSSISDPYRETHAFGGQVTYVQDGVPRCTSPLENTNDVSTLLHPDPRTSVRMADRVKAISEYKRLFSNDSSILGWVEGPAAEAADLRGVTRFLMDTRTETHHCPERRAPLGTPRWHARKSCKRFSRLRPPTSEKPSPR